MSDQPAEQTPQQQLEAKELRIAQLEARIANIDKLLERSNADAQSRATFPALTTEKQKIREEAVKLYGELSPFYSKPQ